MSEFYRKYIGKDLKVLVDEGNYKEIRKTVLANMFLFAVIGFVLCLQFVRMGWIT